MNMTLKRFVAVFAGLVLLASVAVGARDLKKSPPERVSSYSFGPGSAYIESHVDDATGQFTFGVPYGPIILYGHNSYPWSSFSTIRVDDSFFDNDNSYDHNFGSIIQAPATVGDTNEGIWQLGSTNLRVHQYLILVTGSSTGRKDTYAIRYKIDNLDSVAHTVGCRVMLDTDLDDNDGAPFRVPGTGSVTTEMEWQGASVPPYFFVFNDLNNPSITAQGNLRGGLAVPIPGKLQIAAWPNVFDETNTFYYTIDPEASITGDSAYCAYWDGYTIGAGQSITFTTYYGLGGISVDTNPPLASSIAAPIELECESNVMTPNPFDIALYLANTLPGVTVAVTNISAQLTLPAGLALKAGAATQTIASLDPTKDALLNWTVAADGSHTGPLQYTIQLNSSNAGNKTLHGTTNVPVGCTACYLNLSANASTSSGSKPLNVIFSAAGTPTNCTGTVAYDWSFGDGSVHASGASPSHTYTSAGTYTWTVTASLGAAVATKSGTIVVSNAPPPVIGLIKKTSPPFTIVVTGSNIQNGIKVYINGTEWTNVLWKNTGKVKINGGASLKAAVPKGVSTTFRFLNPDGGEATVTGWSW
jgi:PKD repeat protein